MWNFDVSDVGWSHDLVARNPAHDTCIIDVITYSNIAKAL